MIDACFATDGGIDLGQQRGGNLDQRNTTQVGSGGIANKVADDATAEGNDSFATFSPIGEEPFIDGVEFLLRFAGLASLDDVELRLKARLSKLLYERGGIELTEIAVSEKPETRRQLKLREIVSQ